MTSMGAAIGSSLGPDERPRAVLIVDDDYDVRSELADILDMEGFSVRTASHGAEALRLLRAGLRPDLIFLDLMMPIMDGEAFCEERRGDPELFAIPVILMSANPAADAKVRECGAAGLLRKPFTFEDLLATLQHHVPTPSRPNASRSSEIAPAPGPFRGVSEMHARVSGYDWASTPLGAPLTWPEALRTSVKLLLAARHPMVLTWGKSFTVIYNDAYAALLGNKHPAALGSDLRLTMAESWRTLAPMIEKVMARGVSSSVSAVPLLLERSGYREEAYFDVSPSPLEGDDGLVGGMLAIWSEVTPQVLGERRLKLLRDLSFKLGDPGGVELTCRNVTSVLAEHPADVPFAAIYVRCAEGTALELRGLAGVEPRSLQIPARVSLEQVTDANELRRALAGDRVVIDDIRARGQVRAGSFGDFVNQAVLLPVSSSDPAEPAGVLMAAISPNRALDEAYSSFFDLLAAQIAVALRSASAHEQERQRRTELERVNSELEAFSYSVSHDLRAPLRALNGFSRMLLEDHGDALDEQGREHLARIRAASQRMGLLIDDLLRLARITRAQLERRRVDVSEVATDILADLQTRDPQRRVQVSVKGGMAAEADPRLLRVLLENLLGNAWKFTSKREDAVVEVGCQVAGGETMFYVRDNGAGFDMNSARKLFGPFQRLHSDAEFEGTGIGLATVQRIVLRHGGRVWAEAAPGQGATFWFTLPESPA